MDIEENDLTISEENNVPSDSKSSENEKELYKLEEFEKEKSHFIKELKTKKKEVPLSFILYPK